MTSRGRSFRSHDAMKAPVHTANPDDSLVGAARLAMFEDRSLPVIELGKLVGIVTVTDARCRGACRHGTDLPWSPDRLRYVNVGRVRRTRGRSSARSRGRRESHRRCARGLEYRAHA